VLAEQGDYNGGWVWHLTDGQLTFACSFVSEYLTELTVDVPGGATTLQVIGRRPRDGMELACIADGTVLGTARLPHEWPGLWTPNSSASLLAGVGRPLPVYDGYDPTVAFTGTLDRLVVSADGGDRVRPTSSTRSRPRSATSDRPSGSTILTSSDDPAPPRPRRRGRPRNASTDDTVAAVLVAARRQFAAHGYAGTTNRMVAEDAGLAHTAIYNHFGSKARLFTAVFADVQDLLIEELERSVRAAPDEPPFPRALLDAIEALRAADPSYVEFLASMYVEVRRHPELREVFQAGSRSRSSTCSAGSAESGGRSRSDDAEDTMWFWITFALGLAQLSALADAETFAVTVEGFRRQFASTPDRAPRQPEFHGGPRHDHARFPSPCSPIRPRRADAGDAQRRAVRGTRRGRGRRRRHRRGEALRRRHRLHRRPRRARPHLRARHRRGLPTRLILKTMLASPHAPAAMYENEVRFYRELRGELDIETPRRSRASFDPATGRFGLLLEDLGEPRRPVPVGARPRQPRRGALAPRPPRHLHARFWDSPRFAGDLAWVGTPMSGGMFEVFDQIGLELIEDQVDRNPFKQELIAPLGRSVPEMWELLWRSRRGTPRRRPRCCTATRTSATPTCSPVGAAACWTGS
jgi:AcrR family transcriptional regulator